MSVAIAEHNVSVKALFIDDKQMTLGTFQQLLTEPIINDQDDFGLLGVPWGRVNYFWGDCKPDHLHIVWQKNGALRRSCVHPDGYENVDWYEETHVTMGALIEDLVAWQVACGTLTPKDWTTTDALGRVSKHRENTLPARNGFTAVTEEVYWEKLALSQGHVYYPYQPWVLACFLGRQPLTCPEASDHRRLMEKRHGSPAVLEAEIQEWEVLRERFRVAWKAHYNDLCALEQLFLAI